MQPTGGCWQNFVSVTKATGGWCATKISGGASIAWEATKKAVAYAANFFRALGSGIVMFAKVHARELTLVGVALTAGIAIGLICARCFGGSKKAAVEAELISDSDLETDSPSSDLETKKVEVVHDELISTATSTPDSTQTSPKQTATAVLKEDASSELTATKSAEPTATPTAVATVATVSDGVKEAQQAPVQTGAAPIQEAKA